MRHYEIVLLIHPDQSDQVPAMINRYQTIVTTNNGSVHRLEDCGRRLLAYPINKIYKAHYLLMNIECNAESLQQLEDSFRFNDAVIRNLIVKRKKAITEPSHLSQSKDEEYPEADAAAAVTEPETADVAATDTATAEVSDEVVDSADSADASSLDEPAATAAKPTDELENSDENE